MSMISIFIFGPPRFQGTKKTAKAVYGNSLSLFIRWSLLSWKVFTA